MIQKETIIRFTDVAKVAAEERWKCTLSISESLINIKRIRDLKILNILGKHALGNEFSSNIKHSMSFEDTGGAFIEVADKDAFSIEFFPTVFARVRPNYILFTC